MTAQLQSGQRQGAQRAAQAAARALNAGPRLIEQNHMGHSGPRLIELKLQLHLKRSNSSISGSSSSKSGKPPVGHA